MTAPEHAAETARRATVPACDRPECEGKPLHTWEDCPRTVTFKGLVGEVAQFNRRVPVGTPVAYWPGVREGAGTESVTRSRAWLLGDHTPVVMVEGYGGGIALTHVMPYPPGTSGEDIR